LSLFLTIFFFYTLLDFPLLILPEIHEIVRSKRRSLSLEITSEARLIIRAPNRMHMEKIFEIVREKRNWIWKKQQEMRMKKIEVQPKAFHTGETFLFLGQEYPLQIVNNTRIPLTLERHFLLSEKYQHKAKEIFEKWYREEAKVMLTEKVQIFAEKAGVSVRSIKINSAQKRWGSCAASGNINFSWRLVLAPEFVVDYVVAHEVAHRKEMNHSPRFWSVVASLHPDYKQAKKWLRENGHVLVI
jgi:predicted metal-dependent hydrolase